MSAGLRRLANLTESLTKKMDARAAQLADRLEKAEGEGDEALGRFETYVGSVEAGVREAKDMINQLSNGAPPITSDDSAPSSEQG